MMIDVRWFFPVPESANTLLHASDQVGLVPCFRLGFTASPAAFDARSGEPPWVRRTTSPYPVQLHIGSVSRISGLA
jgi:hypothetical protein